MKIIFFLLIFFSFILNVFAQEGKQENILKIEKFEEKSKVIQSPMQVEKPEMKLIETKREEGITLEKPKSESVIKKMEKRFFEDLTLKKAWNLYDNSNFKEASEKFKLIIDSSNREIALSARLGYAYSLKKLNLIDDALANFKYLYINNYKKDEVTVNLIEILMAKENFEEAENYALNLREAEKSKYLRKIRQEKIKQNFKEIVDSKERSNYLDFLMANEKALDECLIPEVFFNVSKILKSMGEIDEAKKTFKKLLACKESLELKTGIIYELFSFTDLDELLVLVEKEELTEKDTEYLKKLSSFKKEIYRKKLSSLQIHSPEIEEIVDRILKLEPEDISAKTILAWHYYNIKQYEKALTIFLQLSKNFPSNEDYLLGVAYCYNALGKDDELIELIQNSDISSEKLNILKADAYIRKANKRLKDYSEAFSIIQRLSHQRDESSKKMAARWYCKQGLTLLATHVDSSNINACYYKEQFPYIETELFYSHKSGEEGFSKLRQLNMFFSFHYPIRDGKKLRLRIFQRYIDSGITGDNPYMGRYYNFLNGVGQINKPITSRWLWQPELSYDVEGYPNINFLLSTTPLNATVSPMLLFKLNIDYNDFWMNIYQSSIEESVLSIQGQKDPYSNSKWGRVIKTGAQGGLNLKFSDAYWLTISGNFDYIWGKNMWENYLIEANLSFGKTFAIDEGKELDLGIFYALKHFRKNSNFFTLGHGGYFSPQFFNMLGPIFRYKVKECCGISFDFKASMGYIYYKTDKSPHYPKFKDSDSFNIIAMQDILRYYEGERKSKIGGSAELFLKKLILKNLILYGYGKGNISGGYNEWSIGGGLIYYFMP